MPRNMTGGSGHRSQRNSEGNKARNNRVKGDLLLEDISDGTETKGVMVARVMKRLGCGRMEVCHFNDKGEAFMLTAPLRGGLRGKGKKTVWVDIDSLVVVAETDLGRKTHEIISVLTLEQTARYRKLVPTADPRLFMKSGAETTESVEDAIEFAEEDEDEIDIGAI